VELAVTTNFSFLRGASHADELVVRAAELGYRAIGVSDFNTFAGVVRMHSVAREVGMKLVVGVRLVFNDHPSLLAWPTDRAAYGRLCRLLTTGKRRASKGECDLSINDFLEQSTGCHAALILPDSTTQGLVRQIGMLKETLDRRLSLAVTCVYESDHAARLGEWIALGRLCGVPLLATNDVHYHIPQRRPLQDVLTCIRHGCTIHNAGFKLFPNGERYLKSPQQMHALFAEHPQAIARGLEIAEACAFNLDELRYEYPHEIAPAGKTPLEYLSQLAWEGATQRYPAGIPAKVRSLIQRELQLIGQLKIEAYFLTVHDLVRFARSRGILCQGRGSAANSAVCYCIGVTAVDPERIDVLFERFVSAARDEPPDIDLDLEHERREEVIQYIYEKYGRDRADSGGHGASLSAPAQRAGGNHLSQ
jgi:error-prone DNA polymerase